MKKIITISVFVSLVLHWNICRSQDVVKNVRPWIGSDEGRWFHVRTASRPYGMVTLLPDTELSNRWEKCGYVYESNKVLGFSHLHGWLLSGLSVMPVTGDIIPAGPESWKSTFKHIDEEIIPGYHKLYLERYGIDVELTASQRVGFHRWHFQNGKKASVFLDFKTDLLEARPVNAYIKKSAGSELEGYFDTDEKYRVFFVMQFNRPIEEFDITKDSLQITNQDIYEGPKWVGCVRFNELKDKDLLMKVAVSFTNIDAARNNMKSEIPHWDFNKIKSDAISEWDHLLSRIEVKGGTVEQRIKFYTDMHHVLNGKNTVSNADGSFPNRMDGNELKVEKVTGKDGKPSHRMFNSDSMWWSCWNLNLIWGIAYPDLYREMVNSWLTWSEVDPRHRLPYGTIAGKHSWIMWGAQATPMLSHAIQIGLTGFDHEKAYQTMKRMHMNSPEEGGNMHGAKEYIKLGYVPFETDAHSASLTCDHAWCDWVLSEVSKKMNKTEDYEYFSKRSGNWKNGYDMETGYVRPRMRNGSWKEPFDPYVGRNVGYVESNAVQYSFFVPHHVEGLAEIMGGKEQFCTRLDNLFKESEPNNFAFPAPHGLSGNVNYGNELCLHFAHQFIYAGKPWLSQYWARAVYEKTFSYTDALGGYGWDDEDEGQLAGVSALLSIGLFSLHGGCSIEPRYELTAPVFDEVVIHLDLGYKNGRDFVICSQNNKKGNCYIQSAKLNGKPLNRCWIYHRELVEGGELVLELGQEPNKKWGIPSDD